MSLKQIISVRFEYYGLHPFHYFSSPGISWNAMLKVIGVGLELISDMDMHLLVTECMRGSISYIAKRYSKAKNKKYMKSYDNSQPIKYITYSDANNLYGWAMSEGLPCS